MRATAEYLVRVFTRVNYPSPTLLSSVSGDPQLVARHDACFNRVCRRCPLDALERFEGRPLRAFGASCGGQAGSEPRFRLNAPAWVDGTGLQVTHFLGALPNGVGSRAPARAAKSQEFPRLADERLMLGGHMLERLQTRVG